MKVLCPQDSLARGIGVVSRAVATRSTLPILSNILMQTDDGRLKLSATNLEIGIRCWVKADVTDPGAITVPARLLGEFVNQLPAGTVTLDLNGRNHTVRVSADRHKADIKGIDAADFPVLPSVDEGTRFSLNTRSFKEMIHQVVIAAATDDARPVLTGVLMVADPDAGRLTLAASDGFRLSVRESELDAPIDGRLSLIVPARALAELQRVASDDDDTISVAIPPTRNQILFQLKDIDIVSQLIEGNPPDYEKIIPTAAATRVVINTKAFLGAARIASSFARDAANVVRLKLTPGDELGGTVMISAQSAEIGGNESEIEASVDGEPMEVAFNARYLLDVLGVMNSDQVVLEVASPSSPGVFRPADQTAFTHIIMPMHIAR